MNAVVGIYAVLVLVLTWAEFGRRRNWQYFLKPLAALGFILIALLGGAIYWPYGQYILWGLIACAAGDVLLLPRGKPLLFKLGMAAFAIGHVLYFWAFIVYADGFSFHALAIAAIIAGLGFFIWVRHHLPKDMVVPVAIYSVIIIAMVITALNVSLIIVPIAAAMFALSDMFVARDRFVKGEGLNALAITPLYFGAQALFALSAAI
ncbi:MAG: lysoplasmalogenase [Hellea sp.]|nr:lysoplasmalogenase [Hellea sp.]